MRPILRPGLRLLRRDATSLQIGLDPHRAVVVDECPQLHAVLAALDGVRDADAVVEAAVGAGIDRSTAASTLEALSDCGVLADADVLADRDSFVRTAQLPVRRSGPDLGALSLLAASTGQERPPFARLRARRRQATVAIHGLAGVGAIAARLLGTAGIGRLLLVDEANAAVVRAELSATAPWTTSVVVDTGSAADVVLLAPDAGLAACEPDREHAAALMRAGVPHCVAMVRESTGVLGPFVIPGVTPCLRCLDLARSDADSAWPVLLAQLVSAGCSGRQAAAPADSTLSALVGAWAAAELLAFLAGWSPGTSGATLQVSLTHPVPRRHRWAVHPVCGCGWHRADTMGA
jgi:hypothetical protein